MHDKKQIKEIIIKSNKQNGREVMKKDNNKKKVTKSRQKKEKKKRNKRKNKDFSKNLIFHQYFRLIINKNQSITFIIIF